MRLDLRRNLLGLKMICQEERVRIEPPVIYTPYLEFIWHFLLHGFNKLNHIQPASKHFLILLADNGVSFYEYMFTFSKLTIKFQFPRRLDAVGISNTFAAKH